jgi:hypothetical protein
MVKTEDKSKIQSLISDLNGLRSRDPQESKFKDWKEKAEKNVEEVFGKGSEQAGRFKSLRFFDFSRRVGVPKDAPLREEERSAFNRGLEDARRLLSRFLDS